MALANPPSAFRPGTSGPFFSRIVRSVFALYARDVDVMREIKLSLIACLLLALPASAGILTLSVNTAAGNGDGGDPGGGGDTFEHGDLVTITGSGFGSTMPTFLFAGGANGILETTTTGQTPDGGTNEDGPSTDIGFNWTRFLATETAAVITDDATRGKVLGKTGSGTGEVSQEARFSSGVGFSEKILVKFWARYSATGDGQWKIGTFQAGLSDVADLNGSNFKFTHLEGTPMAYNVPSGGTGEETWYLPDGPEIDGNWQRIEAKLITPSSQGTGDGQVYYRALRGTVEDYISAAASGTGTQLQSEVNLYPNSLRYTAFLWQNWWGNGFTDGEFAIDDHFVQVGSFSTVELWNDCTPADATLREIQEPTEWADDEITIRLNRGGLVDGDYCLVVLDDSVTDTVLATKEITLTGGELLGRAANDDQYLLRVSR